MTILDTATVGDLEGVISAVLTESGRDVSSLELSFVGFGPDWLAWMEPVSLLHHGRVIFHGKVTRLSRTNAGGAVSTQATVSNFFWLLNRQTLAQQIAELKAGDAEAGSLRLTGQIGAAGSQAGSDVTWASVADGMALQADGWTAPAQIAPGGGGSRLTVAASGHVSGRVCWAVTDKLITSASALWKLRRREADVYFIVDYASGTLTATAIDDMPSMTLDTQRQEVLACDGIEPQYESQVTGVAIAYTSSTGRVRVYTWPAGLDMSADGVKVFALSGDYYVSSWSKVARQYYESASVLQWGGSVSVMMDSLEESPLGYCLNLVGPGTHESWHEMRAAVSGVTWDFLARTVSISLGRDFSDPDFADAQPLEDAGQDGGESPDEGDESDGSGESGDSGSDDYSAAFGGSYDTEGSLPVVPSDSWDTGSYVEPGPPLFSSGSDEVGSEVSGSEEAGGGSSGGGGDPEPGGSTPSGSSAEGGVCGDDCSCRVELKALTARVAELERKVKQLEARPAGGFTIDEIEQLIAEGIRQLEWSVDVQGLIEQTYRGNLTITSSGQGPVGSGQIDTFVAYGE